MSEEKPLFSRRLDRRAFLGGAGLAAGAVVATALVPLSMVHAVPAGDAPLALTPRAGDPAWNEHIDEMWGHVPPYAHPIPYDVMRRPERTAADLVAEYADPVDHFLLMA